MTFTTKKLRKNRKMKTIEKSPVTILHDGSKTCLMIELAPNILAAYIEMNGRTYYIDDSTGEAVMDSWTPGEET